MGMTSSGKVAVVDTSGGGLELQTYMTRLELVLAWLNCGALGEGCGYGDDEHVAALDRVEEGLAAVRKRIGEWRAELARQEERQRELVGWHEELQKLAAARGMGDLISGEAEDYREACGDGISPREYLKEMDEA